MSWVPVVEGVLWEGRDGAVWSGRKKGKGLVGVWGDGAGGQTGGRFCFLSGELKEGGFVARVD